MQTLVLDTCGKLIWGLLVCGFLVGCNSRADESTCDKVYSHIIALKTAGEPEIVQRVQADKLESERFDFLDACVGKFSRKLTDCSLSSDTIRKLERCSRE
ncbi:MAG: hypothetical protein ACON3Z_07785 [Bradymonadia bacterium]